MVVEVKKWGNSLGVVIPKAGAKAMGIAIGEKVKIEVLKKEIIDGFGIAKGAGPFKEEELIREEFDFKKSEKNERGRKRNN